MANLNIYFLSLTPLAVHSPGPFPHVDQIRGKCEAEKDEEGEKNKKSWVQITKRTPKTSFNLHWNSGQTTATSRIMD